MIKLIGFIAAAIPVIMFVRAIFFRRPNRFTASWREFKTNLDRAIWIFIALVGVLAVFAIGKIVWTWATGA